MTRHASTLLTAAFLGLAAHAAEVTTPDQSACKPGGYTLIRFSGGVEIRPKADPSFAVGLDSQNFQGNAFDSALRSAMAAWSAVSGSAWRYNFSGYTNLPPDSADGRMTDVLGGRSFPAGVLATTLVSAMGNGQLVDSDTYFNAAANFGAGGVDFESVALHEMGHGLGLDHNDGCNPTPTVMQSSIAPGVQMRTLQAPEIAGVRALYPGSGGTGSGGGGGGGAGGGVTVSATPAALNFTGTAGGPPPSSQAINLTGAAGTAWSAAATAAWIQIAPVSGTIPSVLNVTALPAGLAPGSYAGRVTILWAGAVQEIPVTLSLAQPDNLVLSVAGMSFSAVAGGTTPAPQSLGLSGAFGLPWNASVTAGASWLRISPASGTLPASALVSVVTTGLAPQVYSGRIGVTAGSFTRELTVQLTVTALPSLDATPAQLAFAASAGSSVPACSTLRVAAGDASGDFTASAGAGWLTITPASGRLPATLSVCASAAGLGGGEYNSAVSLSSPAASGPVTVPVRFVVSDAVLVRDGGVRNAASFAAGQPVAAGEIVTLFGDNLAPAALSAAAFPLPTDLGGARVLMGGVPARLLYVSPHQINLVAPSALADAAGASTTVVVYNGLQASPSVRISVARQAPGVFTVLGNGGGAGAVTHADGSLVTRANPLGGGETISVYLTGLGPLSPPVPDGAAAPADPLSRSTSTVRLLVDGDEANVLYAGASPGFAGLHVVVATLPQTLRHRYPELIVDVQGALSNRVTAGGPSLFDVSPAQVAAGSETLLTLRGVNLPASAALRIGGELIRGALADGDLQTLRVAIPSRLLSRPGAIPIDVIDADAPAEPASNPLTLTIQP